MRKQTDPRIQLVAFDLDGTLLMSTGVLAPEGARLLKIAAREGLHVIPATSRVLDSTRPFCHELEINGPVICTNGAQIYGSPDGPIWSSLTFSKEIGLEIAFLADANGWEISTTIGPVTYFRQRPGQEIGPLSPNRVIVGKHSDAIMEPPVRILTTNPEAIESIKSLCQSKFSRHCYTEVYHRPDGRIYSLGVFAPGANKGDALDLVLRRLKVAQSNVMVIGDDLNDLPMFSYSKISVAMVHAPEQVKQQATVIAPTNDDEGVAWALRQFGVSSKMRLK
jgi:Cof subfamily protein (haloacid dehalogenase superfamily)